jgi:hypothetical protein
MSDEVDHTHTLCGHKRTMRLLSKLHHYQWPSRILTRPGIQDLRSGARREFGGV